MVYVNADGSVGDGSRPRTRNPFKLLLGLVTGVIDVIALFFRAVTNPPDRLTEGRRRRTTYNERQGIRRPTSGGGGGNVRGMKKLCDPKAMAGAGG